MCGVTGVWFVSRQKVNVNYTVIQDRPVPKNRSVIKDQVITLNYYYSGKEYPPPLTPYRGVG